MKNLKIAESESREWFSRWFDSSFYHKLYIHRNEHEAMSFIENLLNEIQPAQRSKMLDLGCGNGRHSKCLSSKGFDVTGIDLASSSIRHAKKYESESLHFYHHDMREPFGNSCFDYVFNFFTSFGYFNTHEEDERVISNIADSLVPGGTLVLDYINSSYATRNLISEEKKEIDGIIYHIMRMADEGHIFKTIRIEASGLEDMPVYVERVRKYNVEDFHRICNRHGLDVISVFGDYCLNEYENNSSPRIILLAEKS